MSQKRSLSFFNRKKEKLIPKTQPPNQDLAMKIIEKEIELEKNWDVVVIHELMTLYSKIIELYEQQNNPKYSDFQDRMHKMLMKPEVISALQKVNCTKGSKTERPMRSQPVPPRASNPISQDSGSKPKLSIDRILLNQSKTVNSITSRRAQTDATHKLTIKDLTDNPDKPAVVRKVNCIIERQSSTSRDTANRAVADFKSQESGLERRKASRKLSQMARSMTMNTSTSSCFSKAQFDTSLVIEENNASTKTSIFVEDHPVVDSQMYEKKLEEIMEKNYTERAMRIAEIRVKYENQMSEMGGNGDIMDLVVRQMKVNMQEEISKISAGFDLRRKEEIKALKEASGC